MLLQRGTVVEEVVHINHHGQIELPARARHAETGGQEAVPTAPGSEGDRLRVLAPGAGPRHGSIHDSHKNRRRPLQAKRCGLPLELGQLGAEADLPPFGLQHPGLDQNW